MVLPKLFSSRLFGGRSESVHDYVGVLVSLEEAHLHSHSARTGKTEFEESGNEESEGLVAGEEGAIKDGEDGEGSGMQQMSAAEYTIEGLKRQVRTGERAKVETEYDCKSLCWRPRGLLADLNAYDTELKLTMETVKSKLINKAIQDIGMGRYNWQLFVLCGFGWFADK